VYTVTGGLWLSGALWLAFHHFLRRQGEFGSAPHPLEPWWLPLHGALAVAGTGMFGVLWSRHVVPGWSARRRRRSGAGLVGTLAVLIVSGYLLYYLGHEQLRAVVSLLHWAIGLASPIALVAHLVTRRRRGTARAS
jgi:hypothetical protein